MPIRQDKEKIVISVIIITISIILIIGILFAGFNFPILSLFVGTRSYQFFADYFGIIMRLFQAQIISDRNEAVPYGPYQ